MSHDFRSVDPKSLTDNAFSLVGDECFLLTAGNQERWNTMTAGWGGLGVLWRKNVVFTYVRPQRFTYEFMNDADLFTCSFFDPSLKRVLDYCGSHSGREGNKANACGITPMFSERGGISFKEARLVFECRTLYRQDLAPELFLDTKLREQIYPQKDYHRLYVGEILEALMTT